MSDHLSQSACWEILDLKTDEHPKPSVEVHHLVGKLSTAESLLTEVQRKFPTCPGSFLVINVCNQGNNLCSTCIYNFMIISRRIFLNMRDVSDKLCRGKSKQAFCVQKIFSENRTVY